MPQRRDNPERILTPAEKQAKHRAKKEAEGDRLRGLLWRLTQAVWQAHDNGDALAVLVKATTAETIIENLAAHFESMEKPNG